MRYFLATYSYSSSQRHGYGNLWFSQESFPSNAFLRNTAAQYSPDFSAKDVVVLSIQELSEADFNAFCGNE